jgi:uncharacterized membrane protein YbhN (UPF0104 family)
MAVVVVGLEAGALGGLVFWAGWRQVVHAVSVDNGGWFGLCVGGQIVAYLGYALALRAVAEVDRGVRLTFPVALAVVSVGFGPMFSANTSGGFSVDYATLREAGMGPRKALQRVLAISALEYAVLAPVVAVFAVLLFLGVDGSAGADLTLPWLAVVPGVLAAWWVTSPVRRQRFRYRSYRSLFCRGFAHTVAALTVLRALCMQWRRYGWAFGGAAVYWLGDIVTFWAALHVFNVHLSLAVLVVAYGTGWALTRRSLPLGGPGVVEILLAWALTWFHVQFAPAAAGVVAYRLFNFWFALLPAAAVFPFGKRLERQLRKHNTAGGQ